MMKNYGFYLANFFAYFFICLSYLSLKPLTEQRELFWHFSMALGQATTWLCIGIIMVTLFEKIIRHERLKFHIIALLTSLVIIYACTDLFVFLKFRARLRLLHLHMFMTPGALVLPWQVIVKSILCMITIVAFEYATLYFAWRSKSMKRISRHKLQKYCGYALCAHLTFFHLHYSYNDFFRNTKVKAYSEYIPAFSGLTMRGIYTFLGMEAPQKFLTTEEALHLK